MSSLKNLDTYILAKSIASDSFPTDKLSFNSFSYIFKLLLAPMVLNIVLKLKKLEHKIKENINITVIFKYL